MRAGYLDLLDQFRPQFAHAIGEVAAAEEPSVVHCQGGRDRTGLLVALLLDLAGVDRETIAADHARSDESWAPYLDDFYAAAETEQERERRRRITAPAGPHDGRDPRGGRPPLRRLTAVPDRRRHRRRRP